MAKASKRRARDEEDEVYERPRPKKGKPSHTRAYSEDDDDAQEEDPGHLESQEFLRTIKILAKKQSAVQNNSSVADFQNLVETRKAELKQLLQDKAREVHEQDAQLRESLISALRDGLADEDIQNVGLAGQIVIKNPSAQPLLQQASALITASKNLLHSYSRLTEQVTSAQRQLTQPQEADGEYTRLEKIIAKRGQWVDKLVQRRLTKGEGSSASQPSPNSYKIWERYGTTTAEADTAAGKTHEVQADGEAWAQAAKQAKKGVRRLVRHLPTDDDGTIAVGVGIEKGKVDYGEEWGKAAKRAKRGVKRLVKCLPVDG